jgi:ribonuclease BN (tRNA processing enzyme)
MRAVLLGPGSPPPNPSRRGPATLLTLGGERFLVDAGSGVGAQLVQAGIKPYEWPRVLITQPDELGRVAAGARALKLAVTHMMPGSEPRELEAAARRHYAAPVVIGEDLLEV